MRKSRAKKRLLLPDPKFNDTMVSRFVNGMMYDGKKSLAYTIFYDAIDIVEKKVTEEPGIETFRKALNNVMPAVEVKARRVGGATFQIPMEVPQRRKIAVGMNLATKVLRLRKKKIHTKWLKQTKLSRTLEFNSFS